MKHQANETAHQASDVDGSLEEARDNRWRLRFTRHLNHAPEKVWRALTEPAHLETWFPQKIVGQWAVDAPLRFVSEHGDFDGRVLACEPWQEVHGPYVHKFGPTAATIGPPEGVEDNAPAR
jgi:Activator of Hsp90 ATPase homolog 1-like protein